MSTVDKVQVGSITIGGTLNTSGPAIIAGPCVLESKQLALEIAHSVQATCDSLGLPYIFKASFDKANRTSSKAFRGLGIEKGLELLAIIKSELGCPVTTDIHLPEQAAPAGEVCDLLQIPAFLARQSDLLIAAAATGTPVNVKKGQFMAPSDMQYVVEKLRDADASGILLCERGTFFGYGRLVNDMQSLVQMRELGVPVVFDATHSVQQPGGLAGATGGNRKMVPPLARAAAAIGVDAIFLETHPRPDESPSDGANMVALENVEPLLKSIQQIAAAAVAAQPNPCHAS